MKTTKKEIVTAAKLPAGINKTDLKYPSYKSKDRFEYVEGVGNQFEMWYCTGFGWCIPTLSIRKSRHNDARNNERSYAVKVSDGGTVRIGLGPHITSKVTVYIRKSRVKALQKFLDLMQTGGSRANEIRDRISTRRMRSSMRFADNSIFRY